MTLRELIERVPPLLDHEQEQSMAPDEVDYHCITRARAQLAVAREALREFGHHTNACRFRSNVPNPGIQPGSCTCGLEAAMEAVK